MQVVAWNPIGQSAAPWIRLPVTGDSWTVTDASTGAAVPHQVNAIDARTLELPLLYINYHGLRNNASRAAAVASHRNPATHVLSIKPSIPAVGFKAIEVKASVKPSPASRLIAVNAAGPPTSVSNGMYQIGLDGATGLVSSIKNLGSGAETNLSLTWGYYTSSPGGCTFAVNGSKMCSTQASGAYLFRPIHQSTLPLSASKPNTTVTQGPLITEVTQTFASWGTHVIRLARGANYVEVEWTAGPIPADEIELPPKPAPGGCVGWKQTKKCDAHGPPDPQHDLPCNATLHDHGQSGYCLCAEGAKVFGNGCGGPTGFHNCEQACDAPIPQFMAPPGREIVLQFSSGLASKGTFYTDSNGREMVKRVRNARGPSYPPLEVNEPVAGNYYPVNSMISLDDGKTEMAVVTDVSMGGSSMADGELELMVHRRVMNDDHRGVQEPLNETMCGCNDIGAVPGSMGANGHEGDGGCECAGLTMRGTAYLILDSIAEAHATRRTLIETLNFPPTLAFTQGSVPKANSTALSAELPPNVKLLTVTSNYKSFNDGQVLLRLAHMYAVDEHPTLSQPVTVDLTKVFGKTGLKVTAATEMTVTGNQPKATFEARRHVWTTEDATGGKMHRSEHPFDIRFPLDTKAMTVTLRPMECKTFMVTLA